MLGLGSLLLLVVAQTPDPIQEALQALPPLPPVEQRWESRDWLVHPVTVEAEVWRDPVSPELVLGNGLVERRLRLSPNAATVGLTQCSLDQSLLRAVGPEARVELDGRWYDVGGLVGQPNRAFLRREWVEQLRAEPGSFQLRDLRVGPTEARFEWARVRPSEGRPWPPPGVQLQMDYGLDRAEDARHRAIEITVCYELYDGIPLMAKWLRIRNGGSEPVRLTRFQSELLSAVERQSRVEDRGLSFPPPNIHVETEMAFGGMSAENANRHTVRWGTDPGYSTQVSYRRTTPCQLEVGLERGPDQEIAPGESFETFRTFLLFPDSEDRERRGLAQRRMVRCIAPWVTENPIMMHVRSAEPDAVRLAIDQCAEVGFEMVILTFGSGFDIEDDTEANLARWEELHDYAEARGIELGGYSLLSSRRVQPDLDNIVNPETGEPGGQTHGYCPALASDWGQRYFQRLYAFFERTGFDLLEHDGSYPGDFDAAARPPLQRGLDDSQWVQWRILVDYYQWCRARGVYLNVPDFYYLAGANKCGMGYRETNWSLPRDQQLIHARQNIYDGTWQKTPSMGWMFVPLTQYHGGGAAATVEPLDQHLDTYEMHMANCFGAGVQACYRGPRLYDTPRTRDAVKKWVSWFKEHRAILESDVVHGRRPDGNDLDWIVHVNPTLRRRAMLCVYNPLDQARAKRLQVPLYYAGLVDAAVVVDDGGERREAALDRHGRLALDVELPPRSMRWWVFEEAAGGDR